MFSAACLTQLVLITVWTEDKVGLKLGTGDLFKQHTDWTLDHLPTVPIEAVLGQMGEGVLHRRHGVLHPENMDYKP